MTKYIIGLALALATTASIVGATSYYYDYNNGWGYNNYSGYNNYNYNSTGIFGSVVNTIFGGGTWQNWTSTPTNYNVVVDYGYSSYVPTPTVYNYGNNYNTNCGTGYMYNGSCVYSNYTNYTNYTYPTYTYSNTVPVNYTYTPTYSNCYHGSSCSGGNRSCQYVKSGRWIVVGGSWQEELTYKCY